MNTLPPAPIPLPNNINNINNKTIFTPGTKIVGKFKNTSEGSTNTYYKGVIAPAGYNKQLKTYAILFNDGDYRSTFKEEDVFIYKPIPLKNKTIHNSTPSSGISILTNNELNVNVHHYSQTRRLNVAIKNIKNGNVKEEHTLSPTPTTFKIKLKLHQQRMLYEMLYKESLTYRITNSINMFVLSDKVGSGKSIDMLALISERPTLCDKKYIDINNVLYKPSKSFYRYKGFRLFPSIIFKTNLIVIPHNIFNQWEKYIIDYTTLSVYTIATRRKIKEINFLEWIRGDYQIVLVKSTMYNDLMKNIYTAYPKKHNTLTKKTKLYNLTLMATDSVLLNKNMKEFYTGENKNITTQSLISKFNELKKNINSIDLSDIVDNVDTYTKELNYIHMFTGPIFERVIFDEANSIKISNCEYAYGKINWFITSSVEDLLRPNGMWKMHSQPDSKNIDGIRRTGFIKDIFSKNSSRFLINYIQDMYIKNKDTFVDKSFNLPDPIKHIIKCWTPNELKVLQGIAMPEVIQALNAGDTQTAITLTHCNISNESSIVETTLSYLQTKLNDCNETIENKKKTIEEINVNIALNQNVDEDVILELKKNIKNVKQSLKLYNDKQKQLQFKLESLKERISNVQEKICPVCTDIVKNPCLTDCCKNIFCMGCYVTALNYSKNNQCPHCRSPNRVISNLTLIENNTTNIIDNTPKLPTKYKKLIEIINDKPNGKFLVFSQFSNSFKVIVDMLSEHNIPFVKLSGSTGRITNIINKFSNNEIKVLLLNANNYGSGLNLEMTSDIIIYHKMSRDLEEQVIGRGQRLGRSGPLHVHYLYYDHEN